MARISLSQSHINDAEAKPFWSSLGRRIGLRFIAAVATVLIGLSFGGVGLAAQTESPIEGVWQGRYICGQGPTGVTLTIRTLPPWPGLQVYIHHWLMSLIRVPNLERSEEKPKRTEIAALFRFYPLAGAKAAPSGSFELGGTFDPARGLIELYPTRWVEQPPGYTLIGFRAVLEGAGTLKGAINEAGCGVILLARDPSELAAALPLPVIPAPAESELEPDLLKLDQQVFQLFQAGDYEQSLQLAEQALALAEQRHGPDHPIIAIELRFVAQALTASGRNAEAEQAIRHALAIDEKAFGPEASATALDLKILLSVLVDVSWKATAPKGDPNQVALTGQLPGILEQAVPLALIVSLLLLFIYRLAVKRSMRRRAGRTALSPSDVKEARAAPAVPLAVMTVDDTRTGNQAQSKVEARALAGPWRNAAIYSVAGLCYVFILTSAYLYASGLEFLPMRFIFFAAAFAWPVVLTVDSSLPYRGAVGAQ